MKRPVFVSVLFSLLAVPALADAGGNLRAQGNEPSWSVRIADGSIEFRPMSGETVTIKPVPAPKQVGDATVYAATVDGGAFTLSVANRICTDTMSGMPFPHSVTVEHGGKTLNGCGGEPSALLHGNWNIIEIDGKPAISGSSPAVSFEAGGKLNGNGSCNRFFGGYALTGEGLSAGDIGASMMMCEPDVMEQETNVLEILKNLGGFGIGADGKLTLRANDARIIVASPAR